DIFHDDVAGHSAGPGIRMLNEVVDVDDVRMLHLGEEPALGNGSCLRCAVLAVQQALEYDRAPVQVVVNCQVDPAETAMGEATEYLVLVGYHVPGCELGGEGEPRPAFRAEALA